MDLSGQGAGTGKEAAGASPAEIRTLARLIDDLDYYQVLRVPRAASSEALRSAYHRESRKFHPDSFLASEDERLRDAVNTIAKRIKEAYAVLRHPEKRPLYDATLASSAGGLRYTEESARQARQAQVEAVGRTPQGREFIQMAEAERRKGDLEAAKRNVKMALAYEPDNPRFLALRDEIARAQRGRKDPA
jgi:DnaJ-class molecular chaperone